MKKNTVSGKIRNRIAIMSGIMIMSLAAPFASSMTCFAEGENKDTMARSSLLLLCRWQEGTQRALGKPPGAPVAEPEL